MTDFEFLHLLIQLAEERIELHKAVEMTHPNGKPILDEEGVQVVNDVVKVGDGWLYIERDDNEPQAVQLVIDLLANLDEHLPELVQAYHHYIENEGA